MQWQPAVQQPGCRDVPGHGHRHRCEARLQRFDGSQRFDIGGGPHRTFAGLGAGHQPNGACLLRDPPVWLLAARRRGREGGACAWDAGRCSMTAVVSDDGREVLCVELDGGNNFSCSWTLPYPGGLETPNHKL